MAGRRDAFCRLEAFQDDASDAELADAMVNLRSVLNQRANVEPWLSPIANQCSMEYVGPPHAMTSASKLPPSVMLPDNRTHCLFHNSYAATFACGRG